MRGYMPLVLYLYERIIKHHVLYIAILYNNDSVLFVS